MLHKIKENRKRIDCAFLLIVALLVSIPMFHAQNDVYLDDGSQHLMRAYYNYQSILQNGKETVIPAFTNGFGYSWNLFYGPLSSDFMMSFGVLLGNFNLGFKLATFLIFGLAGIFMYKFIYELTENRNTALLAGTIYITSPYFFTDIYIRHAMGESMAFVFLPMVFLGLYNLFNTEKNHYYLIFGAVRTCFITQYFYRFNRSICDHLLLSEFQKYVYNARQKGINH